MKGKGSIPVRQAKGGKVYTVPTPKQQGSSASVVRPTATTIPTSIPDDVVDLLGRGGLLVKVDTACKGGTPDMGKAS
jgi:hypothetical protein